MSNRVNRTKRKNKKLSIYLTNKEKNMNTIGDYVENKELYKGVHGFKNGAVAHASNDWAEVDLFLHTWDFLPNDYSVLETLDKKQLVELCMCVMSSACRMDFEGKGIKFTQELMHKYSISPEAKLSKK